jgi:hypothetical protein
MAIQIAPLSGKVLLVGMFGFLFSLFVVIPLSLNFGVLLAVFSFILIIASMISTTHGPVEEELALDEHHSERDDRVYTLTKKEYEVWLAHKRSLQKKSKISKKK